MCTWFCVLMYKWKCKLIVMIFLTSSSIHVACAIWGASLLSCLINLTMTVNQFLCNPSIVRRFYISSPCKKNLGSLQLLLVWNWFYQSVDSKLVWIIKCIGDWLVNQKRYEEKLRKMNESPKSVFNKEKLYSSRMRFLRIFQMLVHGH